MDPKLAANPNTGIPKDMASKSTTRWVFVGGLIAVGNSHCLPSLHLVNSSSGNIFFQLMKWKHKPFSKHKSQGLQCMKFAHDI